MGESTQHPAQPDAKLTDDERISTARRVLAKSQAIEYEGERRDRETAVRQVGRLEAQLIRVLGAIDEHGDRPNESGEESRADALRGLDWTRETDQPTTAAKRPYWLPYGCPTWCVDEGSHRDSEGYEDRSHIGRQIDVDLTAEDSRWARVGKHGNRIDRGEDPSTVRMYLFQHYREIEPRIWLGRDDSADGVHLTPAEAKRVAAALAGLVDGLSLFGEAAGR